MPTKGFTILELLITIAIIGVLAQTVFLSVTSARLSAKEAKIKQMLSSVRTKAEEFYDVDGYNNYGRSYMKMAASCQYFVNLGGNHSLFSTTSNGIGAVINEIIAITPDPNNNVKCIAGNSVSEWSYSNGGRWGASSWAVSTINPRIPENSFCVDFTGVFKEIEDTTPINAILQAQTTGQAFTPAISSNPMNDARCAD